MAEVKSKSTEGPRKSGGEEGGRSISKKFDRYLSHADKLNSANC